VRCACGILEGLGPVLHHGRHEHATSEYPPRRRQRQEVPGSERTIVRRVQVAEANHIAVGDVHRQVAASLHRESFRVETVRTTIIVAIHAVITGRAGGLAEVSAVVGTVASLVPLPGHSLLLTDVVGVSTALGHVVGTGLSVAARGKTRRIIVVAIGIIIAGTTERAAFAILPRVGVEATVVYVFTINETVTVTVDTVPTALVFRVDLDTTFPTKTRWIAVAVGIGAIDRAVGIVVFLVAAVLGRRRWHIIVVTRRIVVIVRSGAVVVIAN